jgi:hypothetical protein
VRGLDRVLALFPTPAQQLHRRPYRAFKSELRGHLPQRALARLRFAAKGGQGIIWLGSVRTSVLSAGKLKRGAMLRHIPVNEPPGCACSRSLSCFTEGFALHESANAPERTLAIWPLETSLELVLRHIGSEGQVVTTPTPPADS